MQDATGKIEVVLIDNDERAFKFAANSASTMLGDERGVFVGGIKEGDGDASEVPKIVIEMDSIADSIFAPMVRVLKRAHDEGLDVFTKVFGSK